MSTPVPVSKLHPISGFRFERIVVRTYFDTATNMWFFEHREGDRVITQKPFNESRTPERLFAETCTKILNRHNVRRKPYVSAHDVPTGVRGIHTYDPAKRQRKSLFPRSRG